MTAQCNQKTFISAEEVLKTEVILNQALIDILLTKQIISEKELLESIQKIRNEHARMITDLQKNSCLEEMQEERGKITAE
jgi:uncharacterized protein YbcC (UPF0753/DUF2309 family)